MDRRARLRSGAPRRLRSLDVVERAYFDFLDRERRYVLSGEPDYHYSWLEEFLTKGLNGSIDPVVRYFAQAQASGHWRFTEERSAKSTTPLGDSCATTYPSQPNRPLRIAVAGCGSVTRSVVCSNCTPSCGIGKSMVSTSTTKPSGQAEVLRRHRERSIPCRQVFPYRDVMPSDQFDVVTERSNSTIAGSTAWSCSNVHRARQTGGRVFHVAPDRNLYTWLGFRHHWPVVCVWPGQVN